MSHQPWTLSSIYCRIIGVTSVDAGGVEPGHRFEENPVLVTANPPARTAVDLAFADMTLPRPAARRHVLQVGQAVDCAVHAPYVYFFWC